MPGSSNLLLNTDNGIPYIIKTFTASFTITSSMFGTVGSYITPHNLPFTPLVIGVWHSSTTNVYRDMSNERPDDPFSMPEVVEGVVADDTNIYADINDSTYPYATSTYSFRIACLTPPNYTGDIGNLLSYDDTKYQYSSDNLSPPIFLYDYVDIGGYSTATINHNLGFTPRVRIWSNNKYRYINPVSSSIYTGLYSESVEVNDNSIIIKNPTTSGRFYYQIFGDDIW